MTIANYMCKECEWCTPLKGLPRGYKWCDKFNRRTSLGTIACDYIFVKEKYYRG